MTNPEFENEFDVLYNNITSNQAPGLDSYEKSVFLTKAEYEIVNGYFNAKLNKIQDGYDTTEAKQIQFSSLMKVKKCTDFRSPILSNYSNAKLADIGTDIFMIISEYVDVERKNRGSVRLAVVPINYLNLIRDMSKPFKYPLHYQAWRIIDSSELINSAELIVGPNDTISNYVIRYVKKPNPIILTDLTSSGLSIEGISTVSETDIDSSLHRDILQRAVELAKADYIGSLEHNIALGTQSMTNLGILTPSKKSNSSDND